MCKIKSYIKTVISLVGTVICVINCLNAQTDSVNVRHYDINLNIDNIISKGHTGNTYILFDLITDDNHEVQFDLLNQSIDSVYTGNTSVNEPAQKTKFTYNGKKVRFQIPQYTVKENYFAIVYYHGTSTVEKNTYAWGGMHYDNDIIYSMGVAFMDYPHNYARSWFVCNDTFTDKASYSLNISVDKDREAFCSGKFIGKEEFDTYDTYHYSLEQQVAPYLVAVTTGKFHTYSKTIHSNTYDYDIELVVKYINEKDLPNIEHNFSGIDKAFNALESHFGKFRFNRIGYCVTPKGSMEHVDNISLAKGAVADTSIEGVSNIVHELGHSWFGNLVTCETQEDMWLNEGWTTYSTRISLEAVYGEKKVKDYWRNKHQQVLEKLPLQEGIRSVTPVDSSLTYSSTVYDKGSMVAKTVQGYFGDEIFFDAVKAMLNNFEFKNYNSYQVRDFLASYTGDEKFKDFFNNLVFEDKQINYDMYQDSQGNCNFAFNYPEYEQVLTVPVQNKNGIICTDPDEELMTLNTDNFLSIDKEGTFNFPNAYSKIKIDNCKEPVEVRMTLHWAGASQNNLPQGTEKISKQHYWTLQTNEKTEEYAQKDKGNILLQLYYELNDSEFSFDSTLVKDYTSKDSVLLLFRYNVNTDWFAIPFSMPNSNKGYITTDFVHKGDYAFAKGDKTEVCLMENGKDDGKIKVFPNPSENMITVYCKDWKNTSVKAYDINGKNSFSVELNGKTTQYVFKEKGIYILNFENNKKIVSKKVIIK
ncbi:MAG: T9SS type A sorting domain-containing protein [Bacteroidales bacterium]|nr:T9SS type A sorting domain-containing protein [Bacteroidales bacterium]